MSVQLGNGKQKLRLLERPSPFRALLKKAVRVTKRIQEFEIAPNDVRKQLSAADFLKETLICANSSPRRIEKLRKALESSQGLNHANSTLRRMITFIRGPNCPRPPKNPDRLRWLTTDAAIAELIQLGQYTTCELFACAVQICGERHEELWGSGQSSAGIEKELVELRKEQATLFEQIAASHTAEDLEFGPPDGQGRCPVYFKGTDRKVLIYPHEDCARRLVDFHIGNPDIGF